MNTPEIVIIDTPDLGDRSYVVGFARTAVVVDPQRDIDRIHAVLAEHDWTVTHVVETHVHNDYVSGGLVLAEELGATYVVPVGHDYQFTAAEMGDGDTFTSGDMAWRVLHTPGHTPHHVSYAVALDGTDRGGLHRRFPAVRQCRTAGPDRPRGHRGTGPRAVAIGAQTGRRCRLRCCRHADPRVRFLLQRDRDRRSGIHRRPPGTVQPRRAARRAGVRHRAARRPRRLPRLLQAHGPGQRSWAPARSTCRPAETADPDELRRRIEAGEWVVDLRQRRLWAAEHLKGSLSFDAEGNAITYLGWLIPWGTPITLLGATQEQISEFQRDMVRIGIDRPAAQNVGEPTSWARGTQDLGIGAARRLPGTRQGPRRGPRVARGRRPAPHGVAGGPRPGRPARPAARPARQHRPDQGLVATPPRTPAPTRRSGSPAAAASAPWSAPRCWCEPGCRSWSSMTSSRTPPKPVCRSCATSMP